MTLSIDKDTILKRINGIQQEVAELEKLAAIPFEEFKYGAGFKLAQFHLHRALEGVFHISAHILSRIPGGQATEYKEMARKIGEYGIVDKQFAATVLQNMAGYRNRLAHFYAEISPKVVEDWENQYGKGKTLFCCGGTLKQLLPTENCSV